MNKLRLLFVSIFLMLPFLLKADHIMGGHIGYSHINGDTFKVTLTLLRDCSGIVNPATVDINIKSSCFNTTITLLPAPDSGLDITPVCPYFTSTPCNPIQGEPILVPQGIQKDIYEGIYIFPPNLTCTEFIFSYSNCCRNWIPFPNGYYNTSKLDRSIFAVNSSPVLNSEVSTFISGGDNNYYDFSAIDPDGDKLVYKLYAPQIDATGSTFNYPPGRSYLDPFNATAFNFDENTGILTVTPSTQQATIVGVRVEEYRDGILIGYIEKDLQIVAIGPQSNPSPIITGIDSTNVTQYFAQPGDTIEFNVYGSDPNPFQELEMEWTSSIQGASFALSGTATKPMGTFYWETDSSDIRNWPYYFYVTVEDNGCPIISGATKAFAIQVGPVPTVIEEPSPLITVNIYPNPAKEVINVQTSSDLDQLTFFDMQGRQIKQHHIEKGIANIPVHDLSSGVYIIKFTGKAGIISKMVIIK